jgi:hypothetical protein
MHQGVLPASLVVGIGAAAGRQASTEQTWQTLLRSCACLRSQFL